MKTSDSKKNPKLQAPDLCKDECSIDPNQNYNYDTKTGKAEYVIPYPDLSTLEEKSNTNNIITYSCRGGNFNSTNIQFLKVNKTGLSKTAKAKLTIIVEFENFDCSGLTVTQRKKKSVIHGQPFLLECSIIP